MNPSRSTFTFVFTDVEGSSRLWEEDAGRMALALARHDTLMNDVFHGHGGHVFKMMGDSVCVAFPESEAALAAAIDAQRALAGEEWETPRPLAVRAAIHRGMAEQRNADYFGPTLNRTARLLAAGHGGQTLLSRSAQDGLLLPPGVVLRDLGERRLRDLTQPEHIYQIVAPGLRAEFPPLRSLEVMPNNLPVQLTSFIGRERDVAEVKTLLSRSRLVTLTGTGGTGKTRLSIQVAAELLEQFIDGVWFVEMATVTDPAEVPASVAAALGVREEPNRALTETIIDFLRTRKLLLVLDNCEHLVAACADLATRLLRGAPNLRILASSREALAIAGESPYPVLSLSLPDFFSERWTSETVLARAADFESMRLFTERATAVQPSFRMTAENALTIAKICWRLDGIPLAIELAAARVKVLGIEQIYRRLDDRFHLLTSGGRSLMPRQQTLTAMIDWSYDLLSEKERALFRRVSVFARGRTLRAIEEVCAGDGIETFEILDLLQQLIDKSLLSAEETDTGVARYYMLESMWEYARTRLDASEEAASVCRRHLDYFLRFAEEAAPKLQGPEVAEWLAKLKVEHGNLRLALDWSEDSADAVEPGLRLAGALGRYWEIHSHFQEGREHYTKLLARPDAQAATAARAFALESAGRLAWSYDDDTTARKYYQEAIPLYAALGNKRREALTHAFLGFVEWADNHADEARPHFEFAVSYGRESGDRLVLATGLSGLGSLAENAGDHATARKLKTEGLSAYRDSGDLWTVSLISSSLSRAVIAEGDFKEARALLTEAANTAEQLGNEWLIPYVLENFGKIAAAEGDPACGARLHGAAEILRERLGLRLSNAERPMYDAALAVIRGQLPEPAFTEVWAQGRALTADAALRLARE